MAKAFIDDTNLTDIADAIRATLDESRQYLPSEMAAAIQSIPVMAQLNRKKYFQSVPAGAASGYATIEQIEGNTVVWNQLVDTSSTSVVVQSGHVYYGNINGTASIATSDGTPISVTGGTDIIHDLTLMFRAGNEPTTVAEFEAWREQNGLPSVADYNTGELLSVKMSGMQTQDSSQQTLDTIALDVTTITGINTSTNVRETIFPTGMKQADRDGAVKDTLDLRSDTATVKCYDINLGNLQFTREHGTGTDAAYYFYSESLTPSAKNVDDNTIGKFLCSKYNVGATNNQRYVGSLPNLSVCVDHLHISIRDDNYTDAASFMTAMNGVHLIYELDTPIIYTDLQDANGNPINPRYKVEQGGTEQVLPVNTSTPTTVAPTLSTIYKKNI